MTRIRDRYEPQEVIGSGGQGEVLRALDHQHGRQVALKVRRVQTPGERDAVLAEARLLLGLRPHTGLPVAREDFFDGDRYYLVMDWVEGKNLHTVLAQRGSPGLPVEEVLAVLAQVAEAIDHLHNQDPPVVHKDVKPANIILTKGGKAVLVDFGISAHLDAPGERQTGTRGYLAPELAGGGAATAAVDIFGLAATAFTLYTGSPPSPGASWDGVPSEEADAVRAALTRGLAVDPSRRQASAADLVSSLRGLVGAPNNIPVMLTSFVAREEDRRIVERLLDDARIVTITGPGGIGKTRLALRAATDSLGRYADGVWVAELAPLPDGALLPHAVASVLGIRDEPGSNVLDTLLRHLSTRSLLLVLDNCEHILAACAGFATAVVNGARRVRVLATSREPLGARGEAVHAVFPLPEPESIRLFVERAASARPGLSLSEDNASVVAEICRRLDGIPLALELAAARARMLSLDEIAAGTRDRLRLLAGGSIGTAERQQTLRAVVDWSYELLDDDERATFRDLSVFAGGFMRDAAAEVCTRGSAPVSRLIDKSLVVAPDGAGRARMLETLRDYAAERLAGSGEDAELRARHLAWFVQLAETAATAMTGPEQGVWLDLLERDLDNFRAALATATASGAPDGMRLATALGRFWAVRHPEEGRAWLRNALAAAAGADDAMRARALRLAGDLARQQSDYEGARRMVEAALVIWRDRGDTHGISAAAASLGNIAYGQRDYPRARAHFEESLEIARAGGDADTQAAALQGLGGIALMQGDCKVARALLGECLTVRRAQGNDAAVASLLASLGLAAVSEGDLIAARDCFEEAMSIRRAQGDSRQVGWLLLSLGNIALLAGDYEGAASSLTQSAEIAREVADRPTRAQALRKLGHLARRAGGDAAALYAESLELARELGDGEFVAAALTGLGGLAASEGDLRSATDRFAEALRLRIDLRLEQGMAECLEGFADVALARGLFEPAAALLGAAESLRDSIGARVHPLARQRHERTLEGVRTGLGTGACEAAWARGRALSQDEAISLALDPSG